MPALRNDRLAQRPALFLTLPCCTKSNDYPLVRPRFLALNRRTITLPSDGGTVLVVAQYQRGGGKIRLVYHTKGGIGRTVFCIDPSAVWVPKWQRPWTICPPIPTNGPAPRC